MTVQEAIVKLMAMPGLARLRTAEGDVIGIVFVEQDNAVEIEDVLFGRSTIELDALKPDDLPERDIPDVGEIT